MQDQVSAATTADNPPADEGFSFTARSPGTVAPVPRRPFHASSLDLSDAIVPYGKSPRPVALFGTSYKRDGAGSTPTPKSRLNEDGQKDLSALKIVLDKESTPKTFNLTAPFTQDAVALAKEHEFAKPTMSPRLRLPSASPAFPRILKERPADVASAVKDTSKSLQQFNDALLAVEANLPVRKSRTPLQETVPVQQTAPVKLKRARSNVLTKETSKTSFEGEVPIKKRNVEKSASKMNQNDGFTRPSISMDELPEVSYTREMQALRSDKAELERSLAVTSRELQALKSVVKNDHTKRDELLRNLTKAESQLEVAEKSRLEQQQKIVALKETAARLQCTTVAWQAEVDVLRRDMNTFHGSFEDLTTEITDMRHETFQTSSLLQKNSTLEKKALELLKQTQVMYEQERTSKEEYRASSERACADLQLERQRAADLSDQLSVALHRSSTIDQSEVLSILDHIRTGLEQQLAGAQAATLEAQKEVVESAKTIQQLESLVAAKQREKEELNAQLEEAEEMSETLQTVKTMLEEKFRLSREQMSQLELKLQAQQAQSDAKFQRCLEDWEAQSQEQLDVVLKERDAISKELRGLKTRFDDLEQASALAQQSASDATAQLDLKAQELRDIRETLSKEFEKERKAFEAHAKQVTDREIMQLENELQSKNSKITRLEKQLAAADDTSATQQLQSDLAAKDRLIKEIQDQDLSTELNVLRLRCGELEADIEVMKKAAEQHESLTAANADLQEQLNQSNTLVQKLQNEKVKGDKSYGQLTMSSEKDEGVYDFIHDTPIEETLQTIDFCTQVAPDRVEQIREEPRTRSRNSNRASYKKRKSH